MRRDIRLRVVDLILARCVSEELIAPHLRSGLRYGRRLIWMVKKNLELAANLLQQPPEAPEAIGVENVPEN